MIDVSKTPNLKKSSKKVKFLFVYFPEGGVIGKSEKLVRAYLEKHLGIAIEDFGHMLTLHFKEAWKNYDTGSYDDFEMPWDEVLFKLCAKERGLLTEIEDTADQSKILQFSTPIELEMKLNILGVL